MADQAHHAKDSAAHKVEDTKQFGQEKAGEAQHHTQLSTLEKRKTSTARNVGRKQKSPPDETSEKTIDMAESGQEIPSHEEASKEGGDIIIAEPIALVPVQQQVDGSSDRDDKDMDDLIPQSIIKPHGLEFIDSMSLNHGSLPPLIPLCRCLVNERVRVLRRKDLSLLKKVFEEEGYLMMKGMFVLSVNLPDGTTKDVDDDIIKTWDKNWQLVNKEFEDEISSREEWSMLRGKMFYVWEGNHRTASWIESIKEMYRNDTKKHVRVMAQFIVPNQQEEMRLIAALQRINIMNEEAIVKTNLKDYLFHTSTVCSLDPSQFTESFTEEDRRSMDNARARETQTGKRVWYPLTQAILGPIVYGNKWKSDLELAIKKISPDLTKDERIKAETLAKRSVVKSYNRRMTQNLSMVNPSNSEEWFNILWKLPFEDDKFKITIEKLYAISCAACSQNLKLKMLKMLGTDDNFRQSYGMPLGDHHYIPWLAKEVWIDQVLEDATRLLYQVVDSTQGVNKVELPIDVHLETYFADIINRYRGLPLHGFEGVPQWNVLTDDHIKFSLLVASCVMDDMGRVLVLCSSSTRVSVERFAKRTGLEKVQKHGHMQKVNVFYSLAFHKKGMDPPFNSESALKVGTVLQQDLSCEIIGHYLPSSNRARRSGKSGSWRGVLERSPSHMLMFIEALCRQTGTILELGAGTGPILKGSLHTGRGCLVIDNDKDICNDYLSPYIEEFYGTEKVTDLEESDKSSGDFVVYDAPSD
ncbi:hypothetical protein L7F22_000888 [Adiantum nelumboides]|nr:hypothetical protein [Adiantum nelumboides]